MRPSFVWGAVPRLVLVGTLVILGGHDTFGCSGPRAALTILQSELIGFSSAGISIAIVAGGCKFVRRRAPGRRIRWIVAPLVLHPRLWMDAVHGDCGYGLRWWSFVGTLEIALVVALAVCWPGSTEASRKKRRWVLSGAVAGALAGLPIAALILEGPASIPSVNVLRASSAVCGAMLTGALVGGGLFELRSPGGPRFRVRLRTLVLVPFALATLFVALLPVVPYQTMISMSSSFRFVVVDNVTGRPIPNAALRLIDPRFARDDLENQGQRVMTGGDGSAECFLFANVEGREGLLGRTETIRYEPWVVRVEAPGYRPFVAALAPDTSVPAGLLTDPPLGLAFPPPPSATIRLTPGPRPEETEGKTPASTGS